MADGGQTNECTVVEKEIIFCAPCMEDGTSMEAHGYCMNCEEYLCENCYKQHRVPKPMRSHVLQDASDMPRSNKDQNANAPVIRCPVHKEKAATDFSKSRNEYFCDICVAVVTERGMCSDIVSMETLAKDIHNNVEFTKFVAKLRETHDQYKAHKAKGLKRQEETKQYFGSLTSIIVKVLNETRHRDDTDVLKVLENCDAAVETLAKWLAVESKFKDKNTTLFALMKLNTKELDRLASELGPIEKENNKSYLSINEKQIEEMLTSLTLLEDQHYNGSDSISSTTVATVSTSTVPVMYTTVSTQITTQLTRSGRSVGQFNIRHSSEMSSCNVYGMVLIGKDRLLVSDSSNHSLKLINLESSTIVARTTVTGDPWGMTVTDDNQVYLTMPYQWKILHLRSPTTDLSNYREISTNGRCCTLAYHNNGLKVQFYRPCKLIETDRDGKVLRTIHNNLSDIKNKGNNVGSAPMCSYIDHQSGSMFVPCRNNNSIVEITSAGQVKVIVQSAELSDTRGLLMDTDGSILVCSHYTGKPFLE